MIRYGIAGFGLHAVKRLMPGFAGAANSQAVALSRRNPSQGQQDAARYGIAHAFATTAELAACPQADAVFVASPNSIHLADVLTAIEHGKHVLCEKPMAMNAAEAAQMLRAARSRGVLLGVAQCFRFGEMLPRLRRAVAAGEIGRPLGIRVDFVFPGLKSARRWLHDATLSGGGPIADIGVHTVDAIRYILADEPLACAALCSRDEHSGTVEASALLSLRFASGTVGSSFVSFRAPYSTCIELTGTGGSITAVNGLTVDHAVTVEFRTAAGVRTEELSSAAAYSRQVDAFSAAIEHGTPFPCPGEEGLQNQRILDSLYESDELHKEVELRQECAGPY